MKQKASLIYERQETVILKQSGSYHRAFCERCGEEVLFVTPEVLAALTGSSEREIFRLMEAGTIHFVEEKRTYACPECFRRSMTAIGPKKEK